MSFVTYYVFHYSSLWNVWRPFWQAAARFLHPGRVQVKFTVRCFRRSWKSWWSLAWWCRPDASLTLSSTSSVRSCTPLFNSATARLSASTASALTSPINCSAPDTSCWVASHAGVPLRYVYAVLPRCFCCDVIWSSWIAEFLHLVIRLRCSTS